jgi:hypothetical protein
VTLTAEKQEEVGSLEDCIARWQALLPLAHVCAVSATEGTGREELLHVSSSYLCQAIAVLHMRQNMA